MNSIAFIISLPARYLRAIFAIITTPSLLVYCLVPFVVGIASFIAFFWIAVEYRNAIGEAIFDVSSGWLQSIISWSTVLLNLFVSTLLALLCTSIAAGVFIENFIAKVLERFGYKVDESRGVIASTLRALRESLLRITYGVVLFLFAMVCGFVPFLAFAPLLCAAFFVGFDLIDLPLALRGLPFGDRWRYARAHMGQVLGLGGSFMLLLLIPFGGLLFFPAAYFVAVDLLHVNDAQMQR